MVAGAIFGTLDDTTCILVVFSLTCSVALHAKLDVLRVRVTGCSFYGGGLVRSNSCVCLCLGHMDVGTKKFSLLLLHLFTVGCTLVGFIPVEIIANIQVIDGFSSQMLGEGAVKTLIASRVCTIARPVAALISTKHPQIYI
jgi:hypothetical protein